MGKPEKSDHFHLVYHFTIPLKVVFQTTIGNYSLFS